MSTKRIASAVEAIEIEAQKIIEAASNKANVILLQANEEASEIRSADFPADELKPEYQKIIDDAREEASKQVNDSKQKASKVRYKTDNKLDAIVKRIVDNITGVKIR